MKLLEALRLAAWVESHDDGTAHPRALVRSVDSLAAEGFVVSISSTEMHGAEKRVVIETARNVSDARNILGY